MQKADLSNRQILTFVFELWGRKRAQLLAIVCLSFAAVGCELCVPWALSLLIAEITAPTSEPSAAWSAWALLVGAFAFLGLLKQAMWRLRSAFCISGMAELMNGAFSHVTSYSVEWHANTFAGSTIRNISRAVWGYEAVVDVLIFTLSPAVLMLLGSSILLFLKDPLAGSVTFAFVVIYGFVNVLLATRYVRPINLQWTAADARLGARLSDAIGGIMTIKSFAAEDRERQQFAASVAGWCGAVLRTWNRFANTSFALNTLLSSMHAALTGLLLFAWTRGRADAADVAFVAALFLQMAGHFRNLELMVRRLQKGLDDMQDVVSYAHTPPQVVDAPQARALEPGEGEIVFDRVTFHYPGHPAPIYRNFSLTIRPRGTIALVGSSGAGKSTFIKLIQRHYDIEQGEIRIDGQNIATVTQASLRRSISVVSQEPTLFYRSIAENIAYGRADASMEEIIEAAKRAGIHEFIRRLPNGYQTLVGERGIKLSGGERQRVAIARAFVRDAPILILDEATSSLDARTEREIQDLTADYMRERTTIVIAHRLSTVQAADRILVFSDGRIVEEGRHTELLKENGIYAHFLTASRRTAGTPG